MYRAVPVLGDEGFFESRLRIQVVRQAVADDSRLSICDATTAGELLVGRWTRLGLLRHCKKTKRRYFRLIPFSASDP